MDEGNDLKKTEKEIESVGTEIKKELSTESGEIKKEEKDLLDREKKLEALRKEREALEKAERELKGKKPGEIEIELNFDAAKKVGGFLYTWLIQKKVLFYILLLLAVVIGLIIHTASIPGLVNPLSSNPALIGSNYLNMGGSLSGLDPYIFYVEMQNIIHTGNVPSVEHLEYLPIGLPTRSDEMIVSFFGAYMARTLDPIVPGSSPMTWFILIPAIVTALSALLLFLICLAMFDDYWIATISAFILPAFLTFLSRSTAGFSQKTAIGFMFILLAIYFLIKTIKSNKLRTKLLYGVLLGIATGLTADASGYVDYIIMIIPLTYLVMIILGHAKKEDLYSYLPFGLWVPIKMSFMVFTVSDLLHNGQNYPMLVAYVVVLFDLFIYQKYRHKLKIPVINEGISIVIYGLLITIALLALSGLKRLEHIFAYIIGEVTNPLGVGTVSPVTLTIAEFAKLDLLQRVTDYNFILGSGNNTIGINFLLFSVGAILALYFVLKRFRHWYVAFLLLTPFILLMAGGAFTYGGAAYSLLLVFIAMEFIPLAYILINRKDESIKKLTGVVSTLTLVAIIMTVVFLSLNQNVNHYKDGAIGFGVILLLVLAFDKHKETDKFSELAIIPLVFFILALVLSNVESRLLEPTEWIAAILIPFAIVFIFRKAFDFSSLALKGNKKLIFGALVIIVIIAFVFVAYDLSSSLNLSYKSAQQSGSGLLLWGPTLEWINQNTPVNTSIISWWDYGYWEEAIANRTAVADGSNAYGYQSMIAKYFFEAESPYVYSTYLNFIHKPTYAVISGSEVLKFSAISTIALEPTEFDPFPESSVSPNSNNVGNKSYKYVVAFANGNAGYVGPSAPIAGQPGNGSNYLIVEVLIPFNETNNSIQQGDPYGVIYNTLTQQESNPLPIDNFCVYSHGCTQVSNSGIPGAVMMLNATPIVNLHIGGYKNQTGGYATLPINMSLPQFGGNPTSVLFMPNETLNTLFDKLYLLNESVPGFKLLYTDNLPVNSYLSINNQVLTNINVYQINYTQLAKYSLTSACSINPSADNYCANLSYLPAVYSTAESKINSTQV